MNDCSKITDEGIILLSKHCLKLVHLDIVSCFGISMILRKTYTSIKQLQDDIALL